MFIDLNKNVMNAKIYVNHGVSNGDSVSFIKSSKVFTFKDTEHYDPSVDTDIEIVMKEPTYAFGFIKSFNNYDVQASDYISLGDKYGLSFSEYGTYGAFFLKENPNMNDYVQLSFNGSTYKFIIGNRESSSHEVYVNRGTTKAETAYFLSQAINNTISSSKIVAISYSNTVVLRNFNDPEQASYVTPNRNAVCEVTFSNVASISDSFSFVYDGINHKYQYGIGIGYINPGSNAYDSAKNLAEAINEDVNKCCTAIAIDNVVYLYSAVYGAQGNIPTYCNTSGNFSSTNFVGGFDSNVEISGTPNVIEIRKVANGVSGDCKKAIASCDASIYSLSNDIVTQFDSEKNTSKIKYLVVGENLQMSVFGGSIYAEGITGAAKATVDVEATATNMCNAINNLQDDRINAEVEDNVVKLTIDYSETITTSNEIRVQVVNYSNGTIEDPMSWNELLVYKETLGVDKNLASLQVTFIRGSLNDVNEAISFDGYTNTDITINTLKEPITYGNNFPFVIDNSDKIKVSISGRFINKCSMPTEVGLLRMSNCTSSTCEIINCEDSHVEGQSLFVNMVNCTMESFLTVRNSTFTQGDNAINGNLMSVSGYVSVNTYYNVFDGKARNVNNAIYLGSNCSLNSHYDCFSKINPTNSSVVLFEGSKGISSAEVDCDEDLVIDRNNDNVWSLNLTSTSRALLISNDKTQPNDIYGNKRYLEKDYCKITITVSDNVVGYGKFIDSNYVEINGVKKFFGFDLPISFSSKREFAEAIRNTFLSSKVKIGIEVGVDVTLTMYGTNDIFNSNLGSYISIDYSYEANGVDGGSRQKHTVQNVEYNVDLSAEENTSEYLTLEGMENVISSAFPCYGEMTFNLKNSNGANVNVKLGYDNNGNAGDGYCNFKFIGSKCGKLYVPTLRADLEFASKKYLTFYFDGIISIGSISELENGNKENTFIDVVFVNSILIWNNSEAVTLRLLESTITERTPSAKVLVSKEFIANGCIVKFKLVNTDSNIKAIFRYNYVINGYEPEFHTDNYDNEGTINGEDCLVNSSGTTIEDFAIVDNSLALSHISSIGLLQDEYSSVTDIVGNYRCSENVKESLDCGSYESNIVYANTINIVVNLDSGNTGNGGDYAPCSLQEAYDRINALEKIDMPIYIELCGYGNNIPKFEISKVFTDSGSINFIGEPNTVLDGCLEEVAFDIKSENALVSFSNLIIRGCNVEADCRKLVFASCGLLNNGYRSMVSGNNSSYFYGCSLQTDNSSICESESVVIGCSAKANNNVTMFGNISRCSANITDNKANIQDATVFDSELMSDALSVEIVRSEYLKLINNSAIGLVSVSDFGDLYEEAESYNYNEDIRGFYRFDENEHTDNGCYDSLGVSEAGSYSDKPNGQTATITEEGSSLITRMLTGKLMFKIVGYAVGRGGYSRKNPVNSIPISSKGTKASYEINLNTNNLTVNDGIILNNMSLVATEDFRVEANIEETVDSIVKCINTRSGCFFATKKNSNSFYVTAMTIGESGNGNVIALGNNIQVTQETLGESSEYGVDLFYPTNGYKEFEFIDHIPFALSLFMRIDRKELQSALGEVVVYAKITKSENDNEEGTLVPFAVVRHGLLTKDKDSIVVRRIVIQI